jgi:hypothetical protein
MIYSDGVGPRALVRAAAHAKTAIVHGPRHPAGERDELLPTALPDDKSILFTSGFVRATGT